MALIKQQAMISIFSATKISKKFWWVRFRRAVKRSSRSVIREWF
jgi:hypothetical protein